MKKISLLFVFLLFAGMQAVFSQTKDVTGIVTSSDDGATIPGASVVVKGTTIGTITDMDGHFVIKVPAGAHSLLVSFVGFTLQEVAITNAKEYKIALISEQVSVDEVVVVGYGTQKKRDVGGTISTVKGDDIKMTPVQSFDQSLQGKASGVSVTMPNGVLNNPPVIRIRGVNSISSSSSPLIIVDGVPVFTGNVSSSSAASNALADINPSDIQSMEILKDASATAIYGSRAANGVIIITTRKGAAGKVKVTYDGYFGYTSPYHLFDMMNSTQYVEHKNRALANNPTAYGSQFTIPTLNGQPVDTKWTDYVYRTGFQQSHAVTISGSSPTTNYFLSVGYNNQEGMIQKNSYERKNARLNLTHQLNKYISLGANLAITNSFNAAPNTGSLSGQAYNTGGAARLAFVLPPNLAPYKADGSYNIDGSQIGAMGQPQTNYGYYNPVAIFDLNRYTAENDRILANLSVTFQPVKGLNLKSVYGMDNLSVESITFQTAITGDGYSGKGYTENDFDRYKRWTWTNTADYSVAALKEKMNLTFLAGTEKQSTKDDYWYGTKSNVADNFFDTYQGSWVTAGMGSGSQYENFFISYFGRVNVNFDKRFYLEGSVRRDGFSGLAEGKKFGTFGGGSLMYNLSNENFIKKSKFGELFSNIRVKASYGKVGNMSGIGSYASLSLYSGGLYGAAPTWGFSQAGNSDLKWESSDKYDAGLSFDLLKSKISIELNYFYNDINNLILNVPQSPSKGIPNNTIPMNIGTMYNKGLEFSITSHNITRKDFQWTTNFNLSTLKNEVTSLAPGVTEIVGTTSSLETTNRTMIGYPIGNLFTVETRGVDPATGRRIFVNKAGREVLYAHENPAASKWTYKDGSGNAPAISLNNDGKMSGSPLPKIYGGMDNSFTYKDFDFAFSLTYALDFKIYNGTKSALRDQRWWNNSVEVYETAWRKAGDVTNIPKPVMNDNVSNGSSIPMLENVENGDYVKVRNISLGYSIKKLPSFLGIDRVRVYAQVFNAYVFTKYSGSDPEVSTNGNTNLTAGIDRNSAPQARSYSFGANITF